MANKQLSYSDVAAKPASSQQGKPFQNLNLNGQNSFTLNDFVVQNSSKTPGHQLQNQQQQHQHDIEKKNEEKARYRANIACREDPTRNINMDLLSDENGTGKTGTMGETALNRSTLSLHIEAYEKAIEEDCEQRPDEQEFIVVEKKKKKQKRGWPKRNPQKALKNPIPFPEFSSPRQQPEEVEEEVDKMAFKASDRLLNQPDPSKLATGIRGIKRKEREAITPKAVQKQPQPKFAPQKKVPTTSTKASPNSSKHAKSAKALAKLSASLATRKEKNRRRAMGPKDFPELIRQAAKPSVEVSPPPKSDLRGNLKKTNKAILQKWPIIRGITSHSNPKQIYYIDGDKALSFYIVNDYVLKCARCGHSHTGRWKFDGNFILDDPHLHHHHSCSTDVGTIVKEQLVRKWTVVLCSTNIEYDVCFEKYIKEFHKYYLSDSALRKEVKRKFKNQKRKRLVNPEGMIRLADNLITKYGELITPLNEEEDGDPEREGNESIGRHVVHGIDSRSGIEAGVDEEECDDENLLAVEDVSIQIPLDESFQMLSINQAHYGNNNDAARSLTSEPPFDMFDGEEEYYDVASDEDMEKKTVQNEEREYSSHNGNEGEENNSGIGRLKEIDFDDPPNFANLNESFINFENRRRRHMPSQKGPDHQNDNSALFESPSDIAQSAACQKAAQSSTAPPRKGVLVKDGPRRSWHVKFNDDTEINYGIGGEHLEKQLRKVGEKRQRYYTE